LLFIASIFTFGGSGASQQKEIVIEHHQVTTENYLVSLEKSENTNGKGVSSRINAPSQPDFFTFDGYTIEGILQLLLEDDSYK